MMKKFFSLLMMALLATAAWAETVEFDLTTGFTNQQEVSTVTKDGVTLTFDKGTNSNAPKWYSNGSAVRLYGGSTLTVTAAGISQVEFTFNGDSNLSANVGSYSNGIWTGAADGIVFTQGGTSGHVKIQKVVVTFAGDPDALYAPNVLLNGEAPKPQYTVDDLPLYLTLVSNNGTEYPIGQYSLLEDPDNGEHSEIAESFELELGDNEALNLKYGTNKLSVREVLDWLGENEAITDWGSITFTVKEQPPVISSVAEFNGVADNFELTFGEDLTVVGQVESYLYAQDSEKGMLIYGSGVPTYNHGDIIPAGFTGKKTTYKGAPEMINPEGLQEATRNDPPLPLLLTPSEVTLENFGRYAVIRGATIDGTTITASGETVTLYNRFGVDVPETGTVFDIYGVVGYYNSPQFLPLQYVDMSPQPTLAVAISPVPTQGQVFTEPVQVTITCNRANAQVSYEIDGYMQAYTGPFTIYESATVRAVANADGAIAEDTQTYTIALPDIAVSFTPPAGTYTAAQNVKLDITNTFGEVTVRCTLNDGAQWNEYTDAGIDVTESATLKVAVTDARNTTQEFTAEYVINLPEPLPASGTATIVFDDYGTDSNATVTSADLLAYITEGAQYVAGATDINKVYKGTTGLKFSSSSANGTLTLNFTEAFPNVNKVEVNAKAWANASTGNVDAAKINGMELTGELADYTIMEDVDELASLTLTATKRAYVKSITITWGVAEPVVKTVTGVITESEHNTPLVGATVTITVTMPEEPAGMRRAGDNVTYTAVTVAEGVYTMDVTEVEGATYDMTVEMDGYDTQTIEDIDLDNPQNVSMVKAFVTAISDLNAGKGDVRYIDVNGRVSNRPFSGVNIVVNSDGTITKVVK